MIFRYGHLSISTAISVSTTRITMAAALPQKMAFLCCCGGSERAASAMTTALSPDSRMLARMMEPRAAQNAALVMSMIASVGTRGPAARSYYYERALRLEQALEQLAHLRRVARHREAALFHDGE